MTRAACRSQLSRRALAGVCALLLTRSPQARAQETDVDSLVAAMTPRARAARMFMFPISGTVLSAEDDTWLRALKPAGVILVQGNFGTPGAGTLPHFFGVLIGRAAGIEYPNLLDVLIDTALAQTRTPRFAVARETVR